MTDDDVAPRTPANSPALRPSSGETSSIASHRLENANLDAPAAAAGAKEFATAVHARLAALALEQTCSDTDAEDADVEDAADDDHDISLDEEGFAGHLAHAARPGTPRRQDPAQLPAQSLAVSYSHLAQLEELHEQYLRVQQEYFAERHRLEQKFLERYAGVFHRRANVIRGSSALGSRGVEGFWFAAMKNNPVVHRMIFDHDVEALMYLRDIQCTNFGCETWPSAAPSPDAHPDEAAKMDAHAPPTLSLLSRLANNDAVADDTTRSEVPTHVQQAPLPPSLDSELPPRPRSRGNSRTVFDSEPSFGFSLEFHFAENPFFSNSVLSKAYIVPNLYGGSKFPILESVQGCSIDWRAPARNLQALHKREDGSMGTFFDFFATRAIGLNESFGRNDQGDDDEYHLHGQIAFDFRVGTEISQKIVPEALRWFTGEAAYDEENMLSDEEGRPSQPNDDVDETHSDVAAEESSAEIEQESGRQALLSLHNELLGEGEENGMSSADTSFDSDRNLHMQSGSTRRALQQAVKASARASASRRSTRNDSDSDAFTPPRRTAGLSSRGSTGHLDLDLDADSGDERSRCNQQ
mmetsp:Transcript_9268/g.29539  ORF Transcript_9268/g.29539 Transcript_9268/m.29539 type:complete len:581 (-) Transcript_9268:308-2050(-)